MTSKLRNIRLTAGQAFSFLMILVFFTPTILKGQKISVSIQSEHNEYLIGEHAVIKIIASADRMVSVQWPKLNDTLADGLYLLRTGPVDSVRASDGIYHYQQSLIASAYDSGTYTMPPIELMFTRHGSDQAESAVTSSLTLSFTFPEIEAEAGIRDIKGPLAVPFGIIELLPWLFAVIAAVVLFLLAKRYLKKRSQRRVIPEHPLELIPEKQPWEIALEALEMLKRSDIISTKGIKVYYVELSGIIRNYIRNGLGIDAPEMTTRQTLKRVALLPVSDPENTGDVSYVLQISDLVKFAKLNPDKKENKNAIDRAIRFVNGTAPAHIEPTVEEVRG